MTKSKKRNNKKIKRSKRRYRGGVKGILKLSDDVYKKNQYISKKPIHLKKTRFNPNISRRDISEENVVTDIIDVDRKSNQYNIPHPYSPLANMTDEEWIKYLEDFNERRISTTSLIKRSLNYLSNLCGISRDDPNVSLNLDERQIYNFLRDQSTKKPSILTDHMKNVLNAMEEVDERHNEQTEQCSGELLPPL